MVSFFLQLRLVTREGVFDILPKQQHPKSSLKLPLEKQGSIAGRG
jgi:hypothetical protein